MCVQKAVCRVKIFTWQAVFYISGNYFAVMYGAAGKDMYFKKSAAQYVLLGLNWKTNGDFRNKSDFCKIGS